MDSVWTKVGLVLSNPATGNQDSHDRTASDYQQTKQISTVTGGSVWTRLWMPLIQIPHRRVSSCFRVMLEEVDQLRELDRLGSPNPAGPYKCRLMP